MFARPRISYFAAIAAFAMLPGSAMIPGSATGREPCGEQALPILDRDARVLGTAVISNDDEHLYVDVHANAQAGWHIKRIHLYIGEDPVPTVEGQFQVSKFQYVYEDDIKIVHRFRVDLFRVFGDDYPGLTFNLGLRLYATEAGLKGGKGSRVTIGEASTSHEVCYQTPVKTGCTLGIDHWKKNHSYATDPAQQFDWPLPEDEDNLLCGQTWLSILLTPPRGDLWMTLAQQYITARLNVAAGASAPMQVLLAMSTSRAMLESSCLKLPGSERASVVALSSILDHYNTGLIGPGHCD